MRSAHLLSVSLIGISPFARVSRVAAQSPGPYVCMTRDFSKRVAYVSPIFNVAPGDAMKVDPAWHQIMTSQYGITALPYKSCQGPYPSNANADSMRTQFITYIENTMKQKVVQLNWTYSGAAPITVAAAPPSAPSAAAPAAPAVLTAADKEAAQAEVPQSKGYCEQNYAGVFDCDCFAQAVLHHRLAHPEEWITEKAGNKYRPPIHDLAIGIQYKLDCTECLDNQRLSAWARKTVEGEMSQQVMTKLITQAQVDTYANCVAKAFPGKFRATPTLDKVQPAMNEARVSCGNPRG
jgi:hypothetical protein